MAKKKTFIGTIAEDGTYTPVNKITSNKTTTQTSNTKTTTKTNDARTVKESQITTTDNNQYIDTGKKYGDYNYRDYETKKDWKMHRFLKIKQYPHK